MGWCSSGPHKPGLIDSISISATNFILRDGAEVARQAHNLKVVRSNRAPATNFIRRYMKFNSLCEKFVDAVKTSKGLRGKMYVEIYKQPTSADLRECGKSCRGIIMNDGTLYVAPTFEPTEDGRTILHDDIFGALRDLKIMKSSKDDAYWQFRENSKVEGLLVQRNDYSNEFYVGESVYYPNDDKAELNIQKQVDKLLNKAEKKNKGIKFVNKKINEIF